MKSVLSWLLLLIIYVTYLVIGGFLFHTTECPQELEDKRSDFEDASKLSLAILNLKQKLNGSDNEVLETVLNHVINSGLGEDLSFGDNANVTKCSKWDYENSLFFAFTVVTTIGKSGDISSVVQAEYNRIWLLRRLWSPGTHHSPGEDGLPCLRHHRDSPQCHPHRISGISVQ